VPSAEIPTWWKVLAEGWTYVFGLGVLILGLVYMRWGAITPIYAAAAVIILQAAEWSFKNVLAAHRGAGQPVKTGLNRAWKRAESGLVQTSGLVNYSVAIFLGIGFILVGLLKTGVAAGLATWIVSAGGDNLYVVLFICFGFCVVMGTIGLERTAYLLLAVIAVPAIITMSKTVPEFAAYGGIPIIGLNLFLIFYSDLGGITPPVALNTYVAAHIAGANPMKTTWLACRLGAVLIFLPFFFVLQPALLIIYTPWWETVLHLMQAGAGIWLLSSGLEGYLVFSGPLNKLQRGLLIAGGFLFAFPQPVIFIIGLVICLTTVLVSLAHKSIKAEAVV
jgi:TRAP-type uncharacterized transport system fused permease subunit